MNAAGKNYRKKRRDREKRQWKSEMCEPRVGLVLIRVLNVLLWGCGIWGEGKKSYVQTKRVKKKYIFV